MCHMFPWLRNLRPRMTVCMARANAKSKLGHLLNLWNDFIVKNPTTNHTRYDQTLRGTQRVRMFMIQSTLYWAHIRKYSIVLVKLPKLLNPFRHLTLSICAKCSFLLCVFVWYNWGFFVWIWNGFIFKLSSSVYYCRSAIKMAEKCEVILSLEADLVGRIDFNEILTSFIKHT